MLLMWIFHLLQVPKQQTYRHIRVFINNYCNIFNVFVGSLCHHTEIMTTDGICSFEALDRKLFTRQKTANATYQEQNVHYKHVLRLDESDNNSIPLT